MIDDFKKPEPTHRLKLDSTRRFEPQLPTPPNTPNIQPTNVGRPAPEFRTPQQVAAQQESYNRAGQGANGPELPAPLTQPTGEYMLPESGGKGGKTPKQPRKPVMLFGKWPVSRKKLLIIIALIAVLLLAGGAAAYYKLVLDKPAATKTITKTKQAAPPPPPPIRSPLTGMVVDSQDKTKWPVIGVMVENSPDARPQSGLKHAGIVYEAIAEAGITRFLALYQEDRPGNVGPIRSARPYYLDWAMAFDAPYAHVGGSPDALARIKSIGTKDLDQFFNPSGYHRITTRFAPHNVYTGVQQLVDLAANKGWTTSEFTGYERKGDNPYKAPVNDPATGKPKAGSDTRAAAGSIDLAISSAFYNAHYDYDAATNTYKRFLGGAPHMDADSNTQLTPRVVVALVMPYGLMADGYHSQYTTTGTGKMYVFQDGTVTTGTWTKGEPRSQFEFKDDGGKVMQLNAGQTWFSVVGDAGKVQYR